MNLPFQKKIGIIGGGQLGKMLIESGLPMNIQYTILENDNTCPASIACKDIIVGSLQDAKKIAELAERTDILTYEIEHINVEALIELEQKGKKIIPSPRILKIIQDKGLQKEFYQQNKISTVPFALYSPPESLENAMKKFLADEKVVVKSRRGGYDGKGVDIVSTAEIKSGKYTIDQPVVLEKYIANMTEYSVIVARNELGEMQSFPLIEMYFNENSNLVEFLFSPCTAAESISEACKNLAETTITAFDGIGLFAVELIVDSNNNIFVNEIAPRPHNSGHHTIEGNLTSQFQQLNRILCGFPLGSTDCINYAAMINLVGPEDLYGRYQLNRTTEILSMPGVNIHLYNKSTIKPNRKMGHITLTANSYKELIEKANWVRSRIEFISA